MKVHDYIVDETVPVIVYDVSIEDMEERRKKAKVYPSMKRASQMLSLSYNVIKASIKSRKRVFSPRLQKDVAIRYKTLI
jgi:hypothetical protein